MSKNNFIKKLTTATKTLPKNIQSITQKTAQKTKQLYSSIPNHPLVNKSKNSLAQKTTNIKQYVQKVKQNVDQKKINKQLEKVKDKIGEIGEKIGEKIPDRKAIQDGKQAISQYASKVKEGVKDKKEQVTKGVQEIGRVTNQYKNKIIESELLNQKKQAISKYAGNIKQTLKQQKATIQNTTQQILQKASNIKQKISTLTQKTPNPQSLPSASSPTPSSSSVSQPPKAPTLSQSISNYTVDKLFPKTQPSPSSKPSVQKIGKDIIKQSQMSEQKKQEKFNFYKHFFRKGIENHQNMVKKVIIDNTKKSVGRFFTNIYWRVILGMCFVVFFYAIAISLPRQIRIYLSEKDRIQKQHERELKKQTTS